MVLGPSMRLRRLGLVVLVFLSLQCDVLETEPGKLVDYFPLNVGNRWVFSHEYRSRPTAGEVLNKNGTSKWAIVERNAVDGGFEYTIQRIDSGMASYINSYEPSHSRDYAYTDTSFYQIVEDRNHFLTLFVFEYRVELPRFHSSSEADTISFEKSLQLKYAVVRKKGLAYGFWATGGNIGRAETLRLLNFEGVVSYE
jgi:hypothetical protein